MPSVVTLIVFMSGVMLGLLFRAAVLPVAAAICLIAVCVNGGSSGWGLRDVVLGGVEATVAVQIGYLVGVWADGIWRRRD